MLEARLAQPKMLQLHIGLDCRYRRHFGPGDNCRQLQRKQSRTCRAFSPLLRETVPLSLRPASWAVVHIPRKTMEDEAESLSDERSSTIGKSERYG